jgi:hypothetical protein
MPLQDSDLAVRRHERYLCDFPAQVDIAPASAAAIRLSQSAVGTNGRITASVCDCSYGGLGLKCPVFLPLTAHLKVRLTIPGGSGKSMDAELRIQRVVMTDRKPTYYLGGAFGDMNDQQQKTVAELMAALKASGAPLMPEQSRA